MIIIKSLKKIDLVYSAYTKTDFVKRLTTKVKMEINKKNNKIEHMKVYICLQAVC